LLPNCSCTCVLCETGDRQRALARELCDSASSGEAGGVVGALEEALGGDAPRVDDPLRDALPGEVCDLLGVVVVLLEDQAARVHDERLVVIPVFHTAAPAFIIVVFVSKLLDGRKCKPRTCTPTERVLISRVKP